MGEAEYYFEVHDGVTRKKFTEPIEAILEWSSAVKAGSEYVTLEALRVSR